MTWNAYHMRTARPEDVFDLLGRVKRLALVLEPQGDWVSFVTPKKLTVPQIARHNAGIVLRLHLEENFGWDFEVLHGATVVSSFACIWEGGDLDYDRKNVNAFDLSEIIGVEEDVLKKILTPYNVSSAAQKMPNFFAAACGIGVARSLSPDSITLEDEQIKAEFGAFWHVDPQSPPQISSIPDVLEPEETPKLELVPEPAKKEEEESEEEVDPLAARFLSLLQEKKFIEFKKGVDLGPLTTILSAILDVGPSGEKLTEWLLEREEVEDVFASDDDMDRLLAEW